THIRSSRARAKATSRYIATRSSSARPTLVARLEWGDLVPAIVRSEVDRASVDGHRRLADHLGERRMGVCRLPDLPWRRVEQEGERRFGYQIRRVRADDMDTERVLGLGVRDDLGEALVLATDDRLGDRLERDLADLVGRPGGLDLLLGPSDRRDLRPAVSGAGLRVVVHLVYVRLACDRVRRGDALVRGDVGEPQAADDVTDRLHVTLLRPHVTIHLDHSAVGLDLGRLEPDVLDVRGAAGRDEHHLGAQL